MNIFQFCFLVLFSLQTLHAKMRPRSEVCGSLFSWKEDTKQSKLLDDCDIVKEQLTLSDAVKRITNKFVCITFIELNIAGVEMQRWKNEGPAGRGVVFENLLHEQNWQGQAKVIVTAQNPNARPKEFHIQFNIDSSNCHRIIEVNNFVNETTRKLLTTTEEQTTTTSEQTATQEPTHKNEKSTAENQGHAQDNANHILVIVLAFALALVVVIIILIIVCLKIRCCKRPTPMKEDVNDLYGTYAKGWDDDDSEGEYGDGDKVYVTDTNDYYYAAF